MIAIELHTAAQQIIMLGAVVGAIGLIWTKVIHPCIRFAQRVEATMTKVEYELGNNGGGTLRDHVDALNTRLDSLEAKILPAPSPARKTRAKEATK